MNIFYFYTSNCNDNVVLKDKGCVTSHQVLRPFFVKQSTFKMGGEDILSITISLTAAQSRDPEVTERLWYL